jgi:hypothetical protein
MARVCVATSRAVGRRGRVPRQHCFVNAIPPANANHSVLHCFDSSLMLATPAHPTLHLQRRRVLLASAPLLPLLLSPPRPAAAADEDDEEAEAQGDAEAQARSRLEAVQSRKSAARGGLPRAALAGEVVVSADSKSPVEVGSLLVGAGWLAAFGVAGALLGQRGKDAE